MINANFYIAWFPVIWTNQSALDFTPLDLFIPTATQLLWEAPCQAVITVQKLFDHIYPPK